MDTSVYSAGLFLTGRIKDITEKTLSSRHYYTGHYYTLLHITTYLPIALIKKEILSFPDVNEITSIELFIQIEQWNKYTEARF